jgi:hypothetical protein
VPDVVAGSHASLGLNTLAPAPGTVKANILVLTGAHDPLEMREQYEVLKKALRGRQQSTGSLRIRARCKLCQP